jgi:hypothetical protein
MDRSIVALAPFIDAIRDAGYRGPATAIAELVDNALEAGATTVDVDVVRTADDVSLTVVDDGCGMAKATLERALQFGGSTRFDSRQRFGRYGMGLPAASISQARRVDVYSWTRPGDVWWSYLDVDAIRDGTMRTVPRPARAEQDVAIPETDSGTFIAWSSCDRLRHRIGARFLADLPRTLGRIFREQLWAGATINVNGDRVRPVDPLFLREGTTPTGAVPYGPALAIPIDIADSRGVQRRSVVDVQFVELPIAAWRGRSNAEKRHAGISKSPGISVLRAEREIDTGWFFMGGKRKENYDDWWRCEVRFWPELDELFGVTHTKQGIHPTAVLEAILTPQLEQIAHVLNRRVRLAFVALAEDRVETTATNVAGRRDYLMEPPRTRSVDRAQAQRAPGLTYRIERRRLADPNFFTAMVLHDVLCLTVNEDHPFHDALYGDTVDSRRVVELVLLAAARAELRLTTTMERDVVRRHREHWANVLAAFLA